MSNYAIIHVGGKQYRVREGERLLVDRQPVDEGSTFNPRVLLIGGDGTTDLEPSTTVTARVVGHVLGEKLRIGKYKKRTGYRRHTGYRSRLTQIEIEAIGAGGRKAAAAPKQAAAPKAEAAAPVQDAPVQDAPVQDAPAPAAEAEAPARTAHPPKDYDDLTVAQIAEAAPGWRRPNLEAALEHERANANRKGAVAALESALAAKEESH
jgi:large subunit ribosomal protein L21